MTTAQALKAVNRRRPRPRTLRQAREIRSVHIALVMARKGT